MDMSKKQPSAAEGLLASRIFATNARSAVESCDDRGAFLRGQATEISPATAAESSVRLI